MADFRAGAEKYNMSLEHLLESESQELLTKKWYVKKTQKPILKELSMANLVAI